MSIALMAEAWPLDMPSTDKIVLLALADAASDEEGYTWIAVKSRVSANRAGRPKLDLLRKSSLSLRAVQGAIKRLEKAGHITREETRGKGCEYWVHPVQPTADKAPAVNAGAPEKPGAPRSSTPASADAGSGISCRETINNHQQPSAGARTRASRRPSPEVGKMEPNPSIASDLKTIREIDDESDRERDWRLRAVGLLPAFLWTERCALKVRPLGSDDGPQGVTLYVPPGLADQAQEYLAAFTAVMEADQIEVKWAFVKTGTLVG